MDRTSHKEVFSQELETEHTRYTTREVLEEFSPKKGKDNISENMDEINAHAENGCDNMTLREADGDMSTGHVHYGDKILDQIKDYDSNIEDVFSDKEIEERLHSMAEKYPNSSFKEVIERTQRDLSEDAANMHIR